MLHIDHSEVRDLLLQGNIGLEKENLRIDAKGNFAQTRDPFPNDPHIVRDFCENQVEINTDVWDSVEGAMEELLSRTNEIKDTLRKLPEPEYLWPFSNPPYIKNEEDVPIARFEGDEASKTEYREYLAKRYGRYKMTLSGIHVNYSFAEALLQRNYEINRKKKATDLSYREYVDRLYLDLAERVVAYGWVVTALTAASPLMDGSYVEKKLYDVDIFPGMASVRCGELGYWNFFTPILNYQSAASYADSIRYYVEHEWLKYPSELYYPVRLKPSGKNTLENLEAHGIDHIELRMVDLNPLEPAGLNAKDVTFIKLFLIWLATLPVLHLKEHEQIQAVQNYKNAAHYDLKTVNIVTPSCGMASVVRAGKKLLSIMRDFYRDYPEEIQEVLAFEEEKLEIPEKRYAWIVRKEYANGYVKKGLQLAVEEGRQ